jgi:hypothetical protein
VALVKKFTGKGKVLHRPARQAVGRPTSTQESLPKKAKGFMGKNPLGIVLHGPPGVGKTALGAQFEDVMFIHDPAENGIGDLVDYGLVRTPSEILQVDTFTELLELKIPSGIKTAVYDSLTGIEKLCFTQHCEEFFDGDWSNKGFLSFQQGPRNAAKTDWPKFLATLDVHRAKGVNIILIAHSTLRMEPNPDGPDYQRYTPAADKAIWEITSRWAQATFFYNYFVEVKQEKGEIRKKVKSSAEDRRFLYTQYSPAWEAKNRFGLPSDVDCTGSAKEAYAALVKAFQKALSRAS